MNEKAFKQLMKTLDKNAQPPSGFGDRILGEILMSHTDKDKVNLLPIEEFLFYRPLRAACALGSIISVLLWICMGSGYTNILSGLIGAR